MVKADSACSIYLTIRWRHMGRGSTNFDGHGHGVDEWDVRPRQGRSL